MWKLLIAVLCAFSALAAFMSVDPDHVARKDGDHLNESHRALIYAAYQECITNRISKPDYSERALIRDVRRVLTNKYSHCFGNAIPCAKTVKRWIQKFENNNGNIVIKEDREYTKQPRKADKSVVDAVCRELKKNACIRDAADCFEYWSELHDDWIEISSYTVFRIRKQYLRKVDPKRDYVILTAHHRRFRLLHCQWMLSKGKSFIIHQVFADEAGFGLKVMFNKQHDHVYVDLDADISKINWWNIQKSDEKILLSVHMAICYEGVLYYEIYDGSFDCDFFEDIVTDDVFVENINDLKRRRKFSMYQHDHCMRGAKPVDAMNQTFGKKKWGTTPLPPCRMEVGTRVVQIEATEKVRAHPRTYKVCEPCDECDCDFDNQNYPAKLQDVNLQENGWAWMKNWMKNYGRKYGWPKNKPQLRKRIVKCIEAFDQNKEWFVNAFEGLENRYQQIVDHSGDSLKKYGIRY